MLFSYKKKKRKCHSATCGSGLGWVKAEPRPGKLNIAEIFVVSIRLSPRRVDWATLGSGPAYLGRLLSAVAACGQLRLHWGRSLHCV